jgi:hypothetical protein
MHISLIEKKSGPTILGKSNKKPVTQQYAKGRVSEDWKQDFAKQKVYQASVKKPQAVASFKKRSAKQVKEMLPFPTHVKTQAEHLRNFVTMPKTHFDRYIALMPKHHVNEMLVSHGVMKSKNKLKDLGKTMSAFRDRHDLLYGKSKPKAMKVLPTPVGW